MLQFTYLNRKGDSMKTISEVGLKLIKSFEGCRLTAYDDLQPKVVLTPTTKIIGTLTIGWGHTGNVTIGQTITQEQADKMLLTDLERYIAPVNKLPRSEILNQNQFDALVSFCYNCGAGNLQKLWNNPFSEIPNKMLLYNKSKGIELAGLVRRRQAEKELFEKAVKVVEQNEIILELNQKLKELEEKVNTLIVVVGNEILETAPPDWFVKEFPNALKSINRKMGTETFWRAVAVALRILQK